jgi:hypothetical protein
MQGGGFSSTCANGTWLAPLPDHGDYGFSFDGCKPHTPACWAPPDYDVPGAAWEPDCVDLPTPLSCAAKCVAPYQGEGYRAVCLGGGWGALEGGGCTRP